MTLVSGATLESKTITSSAGSKYSAIERRVSTKSLTNRLAGPRSRTVKAFSSPRMKASRDSRREARCKSFCLRRSSLFVAGAMELTTSFASASFLLGVALPLTTGVLLVAFEAFFFGVALMEGL